VAVFVLTVRQYTHGRRLIVLGLPYLLAVVLRNRSMPMTTHLPLLQNLDQPHERPHRHRTGPPPFLGYRGSE
jgi:hypothetical protein